MKLLEWLATFDVPYDEKVVFRDPDGQQHQGPNKVHMQLKRWDAALKSRYTYERLHVFETLARVGKVKIEDGAIRRIYLRERGIRRRLRLEFAYEGSAFLGFQRQRNGRTVQGVLEESFSAFYQTAVHVFGAGRTDKGVHAILQTAHLDVPDVDIEMERILYAVDRMLPKDIQLKRVLPAPDVFHARYDAARKIYRYTLMHVEDPFYAHQAHFYPRVDHDRLQAIVDVLKGTHDFTGLAKHTPGANPLRTLEDIRVVAEGERTHIDIIGDGFLRHMVRIIVGNALKSIEKNTNLLEDALKNPQSNTIMHMAPPEGLYLKRVEYK